MGYKTLTINDKKELSYENGWLIIKNDDNEYCEFLDDISVLIINSLEIRITSFLLNEINKRNINLIFTDEKKCQSTILFSLYSNTFQAKRYMSQVKYNKQFKDYVWMKIVKNKIKMQKSLVCFLFGKPLFDDEYLLNVLPGDPKNIEAFVARKYFYVLFGTDFNRRT